MNKTIKINKLVIILVLLASGQFIAQGKLPRLISDGMVLQQNSEVEIRVWASPLRTDDFK